MNLTIVTIDTSVRKQRISTPAPLVRAYLYVRSTDRRYGSACSAIDPKSSEEHHARQNQNSAPD